MVHLMYTVFDVKTGAYMVPFYQPTRGAAERAFIDAVRDPSHTFAKHPEDFTLFEIGSFDDGDASFDLRKSLIPVITGLEAMALLVEKRL